MGSILWVWLKRCSCSQALFTVPSSRQFLNPRGWLHSNRYWWRPLRGAVSSCDWSYITTLSIHHKFYDRHQLQSVVHKTVLPIIFPPTSSIRCSATSSHASQICLSDVQASTWRIILSRSVLNQSSQASCRYYSYWTCSTLQREMHSDTTSHDWHNLNPIQQSWWTPSLNTWNGQSSMITMPKTMAWAMKPDMLVFASKNCLINYL